MRKFLMYLIAVLMMIGILVLGNYVEIHYSREATVTDRNGEIVTVVDMTGNEWEFAVDEDDTLQVGNSVKLRMNTRGTDSDITDDIVENYKYMK